MKSECKTFVVNCDAHMLSELVESVNASARRAAMERYLNGDTHAEMLAAGSYVEQCEESRRKLLKGVIAPHLDVCGDGAAFANVLAARTGVTYAGCDLPESFDDSDGIATVDTEIDDATFARLSKLPADKLRKKLSADYFCTDAEYGQTHEADEKLRRRYHEAVCRRFEAAAQYAKALGSESARLWLEAICLLLPRADGDLAPDCAAKAYETAERAQRALWVDDALRTLPAAKIPRKPKR